MTKFVPCIGCGQQLHITASTCPKCGAPQAVLPTKTHAVKASASSPEQSGPVDIASLAVSDGWKLKLTLIEKAGGPSLRGIKNLPFGERFKITFNVWGALFNGIYYLTKGMWKRAISLTVISIVLAVLVALVLNAIGFRDMAVVAKFIPLALFGARANTDYYKKMVLGDNGWF